MKYDLIIAGAGPAGLMAAKTASDDGLKVLLIEKKKSVTDARRTDAAIMYWKFVIPDEYLEPVVVELGTGKSLADVGQERVKAKFKFLGPGFSVDYTGPIVPYYNFINLSPGGHMVYSIKNELWGFYYNREIFLRNLLTLVEKTKTKLMTSSAVTSVEDTGSGVKVKVKTQSGDQTFSAEKVIAADGVNSTVVDSLGLNQKRQTFRAAKAVGWVMEGFKAEAGVPDYCSWMSFNIPSVTPGGIMVGLYGDWNNVDLRHIMSPSEDAIRGLIKHPRYAPWFKNARVVGKTAWSAYQRLPTIKQPVAGNVLIVSDAISQESWIQGAVACGYKAAKATLNELEGKNGWKSYAAWLHKSFAFFACPEHFRLKAMHHVLRGVYSDEEIDLIYKQLSKEVGHPAFRMADNPGVIRGLSPLLYDKIVRRKAEVDEMAKRGWFN